MQLKGPRAAVVTASVLVAVAITLLMVTDVSQETYVAISLFGFSLFGIGLGLFATPITDTALNTLPDNRAGAGAGMFKMSSSLGAALGIAISTSVFTAGLDSTVSADSVTSAGVFALAINLAFTLFALAAALLLLPGRKTTRPDLEGLPDGATASPDAVPTTQGARVAS